MTVGLAHARSAVVGVVSDTHGAMCPGALEALRGVDLVLHAGDVGDQSILESLARVAPVVAVKGNSDRGALADRLPESAEVEVAGIWIHMVHQLEDLQINPGRAGFRVVVYGHSHRPEQSVRDGVLYVNPGSIGPRRFSLPITLAILRIERGETRVESRRLCSEESE